MWPGWSFLKELRKMKIPWVLSPSEFSLPSVSGLCSVSLVQVGIPQAREPTSLMSAAALGLHTAFVQRK